MGKTYVDAVKYLVRANFQIDGIVEKPDIVGAVFGQTEGLLGDELDLRELQKNGRIGRIEVDAQVRGGKTTGTILVPSSLDMVETSILAASLEIVDRVGPCDARIGVQRIEDSRNLKRKQVLERAKNLLKNLIDTEIPESRELRELVSENLKTAEIRAFGEDALPAGPGVASSEEIIVVEGRADVVTLLKNGITNVIAVGGANVGKTISDVGRKKELTVFLDGDRGGDIILRELMNATDVDFVARAPPGKEVEELTRKEMIKCLRARIPVEQVIGYADIMKERAAGGAPSFSQPSPGGGREPLPPREPREERREPREERGAGERGGERGGERFERREQREERFEPRGEPRGGQQSEERSPQLVRPAPQPVAPPVEPEPKEAPALRALLKELEGSLKARFLDADGGVVSEVPIREIMKTLTDAGSSVHAIVLDGIVTQRLLDLAEQKSVKFVAGIRSGNIARKPDGLKIVLAE
ncbi:MAG: DNA primase DnaG [Candidatus Micrarchaeota archaeon]